MATIDGDIPIRLGVEAADWREAIKLAGQLLIDNGTIAPAYVDSMISSVDEHGPYIVIAPGFALAHARPDESVHGTGMALVRLDSPVRFGHESNDPVTLVLALAAMDSSAHQVALARIAGVLADPARRAVLDSSASEEEVRAVLSGDEGPTVSAEDHAATPAPVADIADDSAGEWPEDTSGLPESKGFILCVCGNGVGTSLFLKNTLEHVLVAWKWSPFIDVEATDTISAKGKASAADFVLTSRAIAETLGDVGVPVEIIADFTSKTEIDAVLRRRYAV